MRTWLWLGGLLLALWVALSAYVVRNAHSTFASLGGWGSDHAAEMGAAALLWFRGPEIFQRAQWDLCSLDDPEAKQLDKELIHRDQGINYFCQLPERKAAGRRPLYVNWPGLPRTTPPGALLLATPAALLWEHTRLSFEAVCKVTLVLYLLLAHLGVWLAGLLLLGGRGAAGEDVRAHGLVLPFLLYQLDRWALTGFPDAVGAALLFVALWLTARDKLAWAVVALGGAVSVHLRALWLLPLLPWLLYRLWRERPRLSRAEWAGLAGAALLLACSAWVYFASREALAGLPKSNPVYWADLGRDKNAAWSFLGVAGVVLLDALLCRNWLFAVAAAWQVGAVLTTGQANWWFGLFALPLVGVAQLGPRRTRATLGAAMLAAAEMLAVYGENPLPGDFVVELRKKNF